MLQPPPNQSERLARRWILKQARNPEVIFIGVFLPPMEQKKLLKKFGKKHPEIHADHMTIWHFQDGGDPKLETLPLGKSISLKVVNEVSDDKAQVLIVQPPTMFKPRGRTPHITLTTNPGVEPVYSNKLIAQESRKAPQKGLPTVTGKVGWFDGEKPRFDLPDPKTASKQIDISKLPYVEGWRLGKPPKDRSYNYAEKKPEKGISLMALKGQSPTWSAKVTGVSVMPRPVYWVKGWKLRQKGSDGEPLVVMDTYKKLQKNDPRMSAIMKMLSFD